MRTKSENVCGFESSNMARTNPVPDSGTANVATLSPCNCAGVKPNAFVEENKLNVSGSSKGILVEGTPVISSNILMIVGSS